MTLTSHIGYGPFRLEDFRPGDLFARYDSSLAKVCDSQPPGRPDHMYVWTSYDTTNAKRVWLHRTAQAYAITEEDARIIERRRKGGGHDAP